MLEYEERFVLPSMYQWLGVPPGIPEESEKGIEQSPPQIEEKLSQFEQVREAQISMLPKFDAITWSTIQRTTFWGDVSLYWLVCKTYQHTVEHTHNVLGLTLFWDRTTQHGH